jgi:hypothetical protein
MMDLPDPVDAKAFAMVRLKTTISDEHLRCILSNYEALRQWTYCPECGSQEYKEVSGGSLGERVCDCGQSWFPDVDYTNTVRRNLYNRG